MDFDSITHHPEAPLSPESMLSDATSIPIATPSSTGQKRSPSPTNDEPSKRAKTDGDSTESSDEDQQLDNENEEPGADIADEAEEVPEVIESPENNTEDAPAIRLPYGFPPISPGTMQDLKEWLASHAGIKPGNHVATGVHTQLLKPMEPEQQDLEEICGMMSVETNGINWSDGIHIPGVVDHGLKARPHQLAGKFQPTSIPRLEVHC
ncbi:hypothetical protein LB503_013294 [Fusarium chuoi]|nr:hypothetical protein LB503_013294 [Fusarium chuoi]